MRKFIDEFHRVFGSCDELDGFISADGWPESFRYDEEKAICVLATFHDGYGETEMGDAEVCVALEDAGALI